jgi:hypothetical protein
LDELAGPLAAGVAFLKENIRGLLYFYPSFMNEAVEEGSPSSRVLLDEEFENSRPVRRGKIVRREIIDQEETLVEAL